MVEEKKSEYQLVKYPTEHAIAIQSPEGEMMTIEQALVELLNKVDKVSKAVSS